MARDTTHNAFMRSVVISDLHFGDPYGCDLLRYAWVRERLWPLLQDADELILLGDTWELAFQNLAVAIETSKPFFAELSARFPGITVRCLPGNHDHHFVVQAADERRERAALGLPDRDQFAVAPVERILKRLCPGVRVRSDYPLYERDGICFTHGHYLSSHLDAFGWRSFDRLQWWIWNQQPRRDGLTGADYEALMSPLHELCYQVAQLPDGVRAQQELERLLSRLGTLASLPGHLSHRVQRLAGGARELLAQQAPPAEPPTLPVDTHPVEYLRAMASVAANLGLAERSTQLVFAHTHTPLAHATLTDEPYWTFHNSGSFFYDYRAAGKDGYWTRCWPGSALEVVGDQVILHRLLSEADLTEFRPATNRPEAREAARKARGTRRLRRSRIGEMVSDSADS